jgi:hypothetical protein
MEAWKKTFTSAVEAQKELSMYINKAVHEDLNPLKVLDLFKRISNEVSPLFAGHLSLLTRLPGLRTPWLASRTWPSGGIYLAVHLCATRMHPTIRRTGRRIKRRRPHGEAYGNRLYKRSHKTGFGKGCSDRAIHGMLTVFLSKFSLLTVSGTMGVSPVVSCYVHKFRATRGALPSGSEADTGILSAFERKARPFSWQSLGEARRFLCSYCHLSRPEPSYRRGCRP